MIEIDKTLNLSIIWKRDSDVHSRKTWKDLGGTEKWYLIQVHIGGNRSLRMQRCVRLRLRELIFQPKWTDRRLSWRAVSRIQSQRTTWKLFWQHRSNGNEIRVSSKYSVSKNGELIKLGGCFHKEIIYTEQGVSSSSCFCLNKAKQTTNFENQANFALIKCCSGLAFEKPNWYYRSVNEADSL